MNHDGCLKVRKEQKFVTARLGEDGMLRASQQQAADRGVYPGECVDVKYRIWKAANVPEVRRR